jgi:hypothetical protein
MTRRGRQNNEAADLDAFNAILAVVKWKKLRGFYRDIEREHHSTYTSMRMRRSRRDMRDIVVLTGTMSWERAGSY